MKKKSLSKLASIFSMNLLGLKWNYSLRYLHQRGHLPNLKHPKDISEILISRLIDPKICERYVPYIDKLLVRNYVKEKGLGDILLNHYGVWDKPEDVDFDALPNKFALKSNNGCGHHVICKDKNKLDREEAIRTLHLAIESGLNHIEPHYHKITPKVYAEELIETPDGSWPVDYKFTCIGGEIMDIFVAVEREVEAKYVTFDLNWKPLPNIKQEYCPTQLPERPTHLERLIEVAKILSKEFGFVRVDLYEYKNQPYISELTFFPWGALFYGYTNEAILHYGRKYNDLMNNSLSYSLL